jgi:hypothetical protein
MVILTIQGIYVLVIFRNLDCREYQGLVVYGLMDRNGFVAALVLGTGETKVYLWSSSRSTAKDITRRVVRIYSRR